MDNNQFKMEDVKLRNYQECLFRLGLEENIIVCLPTGSGKTMIAIFIIDNLLPQTKGKYPDVARRSFFLAPKRILVFQQYRIIKNLIRARVIKLTGDDQPENFSKEKWEQLFIENDIFVLTADILLSILEKGYIKMKNINLIVFDEMHAAFKDMLKPSNHAYSRIMQFYHNDKNDNETILPRIIALSASVFNNFSPNIFENNLFEEQLSRCEKLYQGRLTTGGFYNQSNFIEEILSFNNRFSFEISFNFQKLFQLFSTYKNSYLKQFELAFIKLNKLCSEMGLWFAYQFARICKRSLYQNNDDCSLIMSRIFNCYLKCVHYHLKSNNIKFNDILINESFISDKIIKLILLIEKFKKFPNCIGILFVNERADANVIFRWMKQLSMYPKYNFIKVGFICGDFKKNFIGFDHIQNGNYYLDQLKNNEINFMVATSVLEEGIDLPVCNFIIRFDGLMNYRAYCQSRGRARQSKSYFYIMCPEMEYKSCKKKLSMYQRMENELVKCRTSNLYNQVMNTETDKIIEDELYSMDFFEEDDEFKAIKPFQNGDSVLFPRESLKILNHYIMKLPKDKFTEVRIPFISLVKYFPTQAYAYAFVFPINSNFVGTVIKGAYFSNNKCALCHCAFRVCKFLINKGEIDENLNIRKLNLNIENQLQFLNIRYTKKTKKLDKFITEENTNKTSDYFQSIMNVVDNDNNNSKKIYHLYSIEFTGNFELTEEMEQQFYKPIFVGKFNKDDKTIGLLLSIKNSIDNIQSYFYFNLFQIKFQVKYCGEFDLTDVNVWKKIKFFHDHIVEVVFTKYIQYEKIPSSSNLFFVPMKPNLNSHILDMDLINFLDNWLQLYNEANNDIEKTAYFQPNRNELNEYDQKLCLQKSFDLFACIHQKKMDVCYVRNITNKTCLEYMIQPNENCPNGLTFFDYYKGKYNRTIKNINEPMINASSICKFQINYHLYKQKSTIAKDWNHYAKLFPLEFISIYPISSRLYLKFASLPVLLFRLEQYFLGDEFLHLSSDYKNLKQIYDNFDIDKIVISSNKEYIYDENLRLLKMIDMENIIGDKRKLESDNNQKDYRKDFKDFANEENLKYDGEKFTDHDNEYQQLLDILKNYLEKYSEYKNSNSQPCYEQKFKQDIDFGDVTIFKYDGNIDECIRKENFQADTFKDYNLPNPWHIVQGLTLRKAYDSWNIERLETMGDSFLKLASSLFLFFQYTHYNVMNLTLLKMALINNKNLFKIGKEMNIIKYIFGTLHQSIPIAFFKKLLRTNSDVDEPYKYRLRYKDVADCVESLIGAYLIYGGAGSATKFLNDFLRLKSFEPTKNDPLMVQYYQTNTAVEILTGENNYNDDKFKELDDNLIMDKLSICNELNQMDYIYNQENFKLLEEEIGYVFKNKLILVQAFTHPSMNRTELLEDSVYHFIPSYQRLEFAGDAILDYLITYYIYFKDNTLSPFAITVIRQALVNNIFYASISVKYGLHRFIRHNSFALKYCINRFIINFSHKYFEQMEELLDTDIPDNFGEIEDEEEEGTDVVENVNSDSDRGKNEIENDGSNLDEFPKALADVFESLIAAIYIDSNFNLDITWKVIYKLIKIEIERFIDNPPIMPIYRLSRSKIPFKFTSFHMIEVPMKETNNNNNNIDDDMKKEEDEENLLSRPFFSITLTVTGFGKYVGIGYNKKIAKVNAVKQFLKSKGNFLITDRKFIDH